MRRNDKQRSRDDSHESQKAKNGFFTSFRMTAMGAERQRMDSSTASQNDKKIALVAGND